MCDSCFAPKGAQVFWDNRGYKHLAPHGAKQEQLPPHNSHLVDQDLSALPIGVNSCIAHHGSVSR
jgi:hypothetical protein